MQLGIDRLLAEPNRLHGQRVGPVLHAASFTSNGVPSLQALRPFNLTALFGPEHGLTTVAQDMEGVAHATDAEHGLPIFSLYGDSLASLKPTRAMCDLIDVFVVDLQDIGSRYYTYIYTMAYCLQAAAEFGKKIIVCDRPNPINGLTVESALVDPGFNSFVGMYPLPVRHGMTIGELAQLFNTDIGCDLTVIPMQGWQRKYYWDETGLAWVNPSPNMRSLHAALLYPGWCLLEGTNVSEGRGTDAPFDLCGAPWVSGKILAQTLNELKLPGVRFEATHFTPTFQKHAGQKCEGVRAHITDRTTFAPYRSGIALLWALAHTAPEHFAWRTERYEFVDDIPAIDLLTGNASIRQAIDRNVSWDALQRLISQTPGSFLTQRQTHLLY